MTEAELEAQIAAKGLTAPRITPEHINATITGESAAASPANFNAEIGRNIAKQNAREKIWALEGYLLKEALYRG